MKITILYFQALRDLLGKTEEQLELNEAETAGSILEKLKAQHPELQAYRNSILLAINEEWAKPDETLSDGDTLALMPPVSGG